MTLTELLTKHKISQRKLATQMGYSPAVINQLVKHGKYPKSIEKEVLHNEIATALKNLGIQQMPTWEHPPQSPLNKGGSKKSQPKTKTQPKELPIMQAPTIKLNPQTLKLFRLVKSPFERDVQCRDDVYLSEEQHYIRQNMLYTAKNADVMAIIGESGSGKTTLKEDLIEAIKQNNEKIILIQIESFNKDKLTVSSLCDAIIDDVSHGTVKAKRGMEAKSRQIKRLLTEVTHYNF